jgi:hypothetical protein
MFKGVSKECNEASKLHGLPPKTCQNGALGSMILMFVHELLEGVTNPSATVFYNLHGFTM